MTKGALRNGKAEGIGRENGNAGVELGVLEVPIIEGGASPEAKDAARDAALDAETAEGVGGAEAKDAPAPAAAAAREDPAPKPVPYFQLFRYATPWERVMVGAGLVFGLVTSIGLPVIIILYGEYTTLLVDRNMENVTSSRTHVLDLFGGGRVLVNGSWEQRREALLEDSAAFGLGALAAAALQSALAICCISCLNTAAHRQVGRVRRLFLRAVLRQEMAWFDTRDPSAFASRLTEDLDKMQDGIGEKLGMFMYLIVSFVGSVIMSFVHGWKLTLVVLTCAPVIIVATALVAKMQGNLAAREQQAYGAAGAAVEEALAAIRTVAMGCKRGLYTGLGSGVFWFIVYASYSLAFWYGVELILEGRETGSNEYTPAVLVIVLFGVLSGAMNMGLASPHLEAFAQGTHAELLARRGHYYALVAAAAVAGAADEDAVSPSEEPLELEAGGEALPAGLAKRLSVAVSLRKDSCAPDQQLPDALKELSLQEPRRCARRTALFRGPVPGGGRDGGPAALGADCTCWGRGRTTADVGLRREAFAALYLSGAGLALQATGSRIGSILQAISTLVIGVLLALYYSWKLTLVSVLGVPLVFAGVFLEARVLRSQGLHEKEALESASKGWGRKGAGARFLRRYGDALAAAEAAAAPDALAGRRLRHGQCSPFLAYALTFYYGGFSPPTEGSPTRRSSNKEVNLGSSKEKQALLFGAWMLGQTLALAPSFSAAKLAAGRLFALLDRQPAIDSGAEDAPLSVRHFRNLMFGLLLIFKTCKMEGIRQEAAGRVEYDGVEFAYPTRPEARVLRGLRLQVPAGATVALVGPSGCGKSTCLQLLQRLYDPLAGSVLVDGRATTALPLEALRAQLGIVSQEPVLFDRTIAENIAYGDNARAVPIDEVIAAAKAANIHAFIAALPQGYETRLGAKGTQLSGGQKQRVAIARALVRNPRILLLDEATSALDSQSEKVVQQALDEAQEGRTCIVIAHRLATVQQADLICVVNNGVIAETGTHSQLLARKGLYYFMHRRDNHMSDV
ncbi:Multidrug resistance protein homolog 65 [Gryllus bimaculatus]|nr:Multidrug resistance protein homolog 65 [Gryllus bimaculatus]